MTLMSIFYVLFTESLGMMYLIANLMHDPIVVAVQVLPMKKNEGVAMLAWQCHNGRLK
jgi:hypothetical protein